MTDLLQITCTVSVLLINDAFTRHLAEAYPDCDLYTALAAYVTDKVPADVTPEERGAAKKGAHASIYGGIA